MKILAEPDPYNAWFDARLISLDPLVTLSSIENGMVWLAEFARDCPQVFDRPTGFHLLSTTWGIGKVLTAASLKRSVERAMQQLPGHHFVLMASDEGEQFELLNEGIDCIVCNSSIFVDEQVWRPTLPHNREFGSFDAVYNARLMAYKRHELAAGIESLLLIHAAPFGAGKEAEFARIRTLLPKARSANELHGTPWYDQMTPELVCEFLAHAKCGLALSREEGVMKASVEYMLCGLPVVSTASLGGRDRYYVFPFTQIAQDDPEAVAAAVTTMVRRQFDRNAVRQAIAGLIAFDRHNFLEAIAKAVGKYLGATLPQEGFEPYRGFKKRFLRSHVAMEALASSAARLKERRQ
ncbi:MAG: glycosyltransferase [Nitratireductor sp.]|nr:glycosyltransferase [Nitratireductor sp.]